MPARTSGDWEACEGAGMSASVVAAVATDGLCLMPYAERLTRRTQAAPGLQGSFSPVSKLGYTFMCPRLTLHGAHAATRPLHARAHGRWQVQVLSALATRNAPARGLARKPAIQPRAVGQLPRGISSCCARQRWLGVGARVLGISRQRLGRRARRLAAPLLVSQTWPFEWRALERGGTGAARKNVGRRRFTS